MSRGKQVPCHRQVGGRHRKPQRKLAKSKYRKNDTSVSKKSKRKEVNNEVKEKFKREAYDIAKNIFIGVVVAVLSTLALMGIGGANSDERDNTN